MAQKTTSFGPEPVTTKKLNVFGGVFTPDVLTILGVIMYLRLGWVVGNAGLLGAILIILLAKTITICTALSMSSITTNIKIGSGGAYSIITKSLGLEAGGSIGIPFYISQTLATALYIVGFTEGWMHVFPDHPHVLVSIIAWLLLVSISYISAHFAIKIQYFIMVIVAMSILSFVFTRNEPNTTINVIGKFEDASFWQVFAIFFPAVTGIMAGANLSGDLANPRKAIPLGTLSAIGVTMIIYIIMAIVAAKFISPAELRSNQMVMVDYAFWGPLVLMGILAATFSSALGSLIGAPRILQALSEQKTVPLYQIFSKKTPNNEPRNATIFTSLIILAALLLGNLDALAALITMFFLITYGMINLVVFMQQSMKIISFRPTFKIPMFVSLLGAVGSIFVMFLINPVFSLVAFAVIISLYIWLGRRGLKSDSGDIRGGFFLVLAEKASRLAAKFPRHQVSWKPDLLIPIKDPDTWTGSVQFIKNIVYPSGSVFAFTVKDHDLEATEKSLSELLSPLEGKNLLVHSIVLEHKKFLPGARLIMQTLKAGALRPNTLFLTLGNNVTKESLISKLSVYASNNDLGTIMLRQHPKIEFGAQKTINLWLRDKSPNFHLAVLTALQLQLNWQGNLNLISVGLEEADRKRLYKFLEHINDQARLPSMTEYYVFIGNFMDSLQKAPKADINIFGLADTLYFDFLREAPDLTNSSCLFIRDSGKESALV